MPTTTNTINGTNGNDTLTGTTGNDTINTGNGNDYVDAGAGNDSITAGNGNDTVNAGTGNDTINAGNGNDKLFGGAGNDVINGGNGQDVIDGGSGNDTIHAGNGADTIYGDGLEASGGVLAASMGNDVIYGGNGNDVIYGDNGTTVGAAATVNFLTASGGDDVIWAGNGNDLVYGEGGNDTIHGGNGSDVLDGGAGNDLIFGGNGGDLIFGGSGNDTISGANGKDTIYGGSGDDVIGSNACQRGDDGGENGKDVIYGDGLERAGGANALTPGNDLIYSGNGSDLVYGDNGDNLTGAGAGGNDTIYAGAGNDTVYGEGGNDLLFGEKGNDVLNGGAGNDTINGGLGADTLTGGTGNDVFVFTAGISTSDHDDNDDANHQHHGYDHDGTDNWSDSNASAMDVITDFQGVRDVGAASNIDKIDLTQLLGSTDLKWGGTTPTAKGVWYVQSGGNTFVYADINGNVGTPELAIELLGLHNLTNNDFLGVANAAPIAVADTNAVTEDGTVLTVTGNVLANDSDPDFNALLSVAGPGTYTGTYGTLAISANGSYSYTLANDQANVQALAQGQIVHDVFSYSANDGITSTPSTLTINITGTNDAAVITGTSTASLTETDAVLTASGALIATDVDSSAAFVAQTNVAGNHGYGHFSINAAGVWTYSTDTAHNEFAAGTTYTDSITVATADGTTQVITVSIAGTNDAAVITGTSTASLTETDAVLTASGALIATDVDSSAAFVAQTNVAGNHGYGHFSINAAGVWTYSTDTAHNEFAAGTTYTDSITVATADGTTQVITVSIAGTNDAAVITGTSTASLTETDAVLTASGALIATDVDSSAAFVAQTNVAGNHGYGHFSINAAGVWTYSTDTAHNEFAAGTTYTDSITVATADGTTQVITVSIAGTNDAAVITGTSTASLTETDAVLTASGALIATDVDSSAAFVAQTNVAGNHGYGHFSINAAGVWTYSTDTAHNEFAAGTTYTDSITVATADGTTQVITVSIAGTNDAPVITSAAQAGTVKEDTTLVATGTVSSSDVDHGATAAYSGDATGTYGSFAVNASTGVWTYTLDNAAHQNLAAGETQHETFTVTVTDDQGATATQDVTITIQGTNDAPVITSAAQAGTVKEDTTLVATGTVSSSDVDHGATAAYSGDATGTYGSFAVNASTGVWTYTLDNAAHQNLAAGETQHETFTVTVTDDQGATATQDVTITIQGTNDAPVITSAAQAGTVKEDTTLVATGTVSSSDVDHGATAAYSGDATGTYGSFAVNASTGVWTYTLDNAAHQNLAAGETQHETFTVTVTDDQGATATQDVTITIQGTNDAPVITSAAQAGTVKEDTTLVATGTVSSSDVDHGATAAYSGDATGTYGSFAVNASTGVWTYTLDNAAHQNLAAGETQHETFTVTVTDDQGATATQDVTITIQGTNDAPVITSAAQAGTVKEDTTLVATGTVSSSDVDHGATAAYSGDATGTYGSFAVNASTGVWTYTLDNAAHQNLAAGETQHETFTVTVTDDQGATATQDVTITIQGTNDAPVITSAAQAGTVKEDTTLVATGTVSSSDVDHGATAAYSGDATGTYGSFAVNASTGVWTYTLDNAAHQNLAAGETQHETFTVTVTDDQGATATQDVTITIQGTNDAPVITSAAQAGTVKEDTTLVATGTVSSSDVDHGATAAYSGDATGTYGSFAVNASTGVWTYTLDNAAHQNLAAGETQHETFTVTVTDDQGATATQDVTITIQGTNDAPVITSAAQAGTVKEDTTLVATGTVSSSDVDHGATAAYSGDATGTYGSFAVNASTGVWTYTLDNAAHQNLAAGETQHETFTVTVTDDQGATATQDVTITIQGTNDAPVITSAAQAGTVKEDTTLVATGTVSSSDVDHGATAAYSGDATGTYGSFAVNASTGVWTYTLDNAAHQNLAAGETQHETFTVTVTDDQGATATQDVTITIQGTNDAPVITSAAQAGTVKEDTTLVATGTVSSSDVDHGATAAYSGDATGTYGSFAVNASTGVWTYTLDNAAHQNLAAGETQHETFTVTVTDDQGATATQDVTITIQGTNDAPVITSAAQAGTVKEDTTLVATGTVSSSDVDHGATAAYSGDATGTYGSFAVNASTGVWTYTLDNAAHQNLAAGETQHETFTVTVTDDQGATATQDVTITIQGTNDAPVITSAAQAGTVKEDTTLVATGTVSSSDVDHGATAAYSGDATGTYGSFAVNASTGVWTYTLDNAAHQNLAAGETQHETFTVTVTDDQGATATQDVTITIQGTNDAPVITSAAQAGTVKEDTTLVATGTVSSSDVDHGATAAYSGDATGTYGSFAVNASTGVWTYTLDNAAHQNLAAGETQHETFTVTVTDDQGATATQDVTITIQGTNDAPVITSAAQAGTVKEDTTLVATGTVSSSDVDHGATAAYSGDATGTYGSFAVNASTGVWTYTLDNAAHQNLAAGETQHETFTVTVTDDQGATATQDVTITIQGTNDAPVITSAAQAGTVKEDTTLVATGTVSSSDVDHGATAAYSGDATGTYGSFAVNASTGVWTYTLDNAAHQNLAAGETQHETFTVTVTDDQGATATQDVTITIQGTNDAPVITSAAQAGTVKEDTTLVATGTVSSSDVDHGATAAYSGDATGTYGSFAVNASTGVWTYTLDNAAHQNLAAGETQHETFTVTVTDDQGATATQDVTITIQGTNDAPVITSAAQAGTVKEDTTLVATGTVSSSDVDHGATAAYSGDATGTYGSFAVNASTGVWTYTLDNAAHQNLAAGETQHETFTVTVTDDQGATATQDVTITIQGTNDAPVITSAAQAGTVKEDTTLVATGTVSSSDVDHGATAAYSGDATGTYGSFAVNASTGVWTYTLDNAAHQNLAAGETQHETFTVTVTDDQGATATQDVTITIQGTNDAPVITSAAQAGTVKEDTTLVATGTVSSSDVDHGATAAYSGDATGTYGSFAVNASTGVWTYTLDNAAHQNLAAGETQHETFTVTVTDDQGATATQDVTITIQGTNDAPVITSAAQAGTVKEDTTLVATGTVSSSDVDHGATAAYSGDATGTYGSFAVNASTGVWTYTLDNAAHQNLAAGETQHETFTVTVTDDQGATATQDVTITIQGTNDAPVITSAAQAGTVKEDTTLVATGTVSSSDVDHGATAAYSGDATGTYGSFAVNASTGVWTYTLDNAAHQNLAAGETQHETFTVTVTDDQGATATQDVTITIQGTNDAPVITSAAQAGTVKEDTTLVATGTVSSSDVDHGATAAYSGDATGTYGSFAVNASTGVWTYTLDNAAHQNLAAGETQHETFTVTVTDDQGATATQDVTITIQGTNDAPVITSAAQAGTVKEDTTLVATGTVSSSDVDHGATAAYSGDATGTYGSFAVNASTGVWTYTLDNAAHQNLAAGETQHETFTVTVTDDQGATATQDVTITIQGTNDAPVITSAAQAGTVKEDTTLVATGTVSSSDVDHGATAAYSGDATGTYGSFAVNASTGVWTYTLDNAAHQNLAAGETQHETFTVTVTDDQGATATQDVTITIQGTNDAPVITSAAQAGTVKEDTTLVATGTVSSSDVDHGATAAYSGDATGTYGSFAVNASTGVWTYTLDNAAHQNLAAGETQHETFTVTVTDDQGATATQDVTITIQGTNDAPVITSAAQAGTVKEDTTLVATGTVSSSDVDHGATAAYSGDATGTYGSFAVNASTGVWTYTLDNAAHQNLAAGETQHETFTVTVTDDQGATATQDVTITIQGTNDAPVITSAAQAGTVKEDTTLVATGTVSSSDVDHGATAAYSGDATGTYGSFAVNASTGVWTYTLDNAAHQNLAAGETQHETFTVTVTDDQGATATQDVTITIQGTNDAPVITSAAQAGTVKEDTTLVATGTVSSSDVDHGATAAYSGDATGTYGSFAVNASTGVWTYTLDNAAHQNLAAGETQHETFTVTVTDDQGATATQDVTITIQGTNDAPVITSAAQAGTVKEDTTLVATGTVSSSDVDHGATAAYSGDATGTYGSFAVNASTGVWTYTLDNAAHQNLAAGETQHETFTVTVTDDQGATATQDVTITIQGTNDAPVITSAAQAGTVKEDTTLVATGTVSSSDVDHGATAAYSGDATGTYGSFAVNASTGVWTYTLDNAAHQNLAAGETQHETFTVTVTDDQGATATQDVTITIQGTNDAPVITSAAQAGTVKEDTTLVATGTVSSSDVDHGATAAYSGDATGTYGSFAVNASTGVWTYTLDNAAHQNLAAGETQHETFTVTVTDDQGATATQDVTITIQGTNDAPVITSAAQAGTVKEDTTLVATGTVSSSDVDHGATAAYSGDATGTYGSFAVNASTGVWTYTLDNAAHQNLAAGETQHETFTVTVTDDQGATATQDVTITIQGTNDAPVITSAAQAGTVKEDTTLVATGTVSSSDVDHGATAAYSGDATGTYGSFAVNASTGVWTYTLDNAAHQNLAAGETQHETFTVTVTDDQGATATQDVTITIQGTNDAPVITSAAQAGTVKEDTTLVATGTVSSSDVDHGATAAYSGDATGTYGSFAVNASTGVWTYTLDNAAHQNLAAGETQHETFTVTVTDDQGATATQDVTITIQGTNDAPVITSAAQAGTVKEDTTLVATGTVSSSDVDHGATAAYSGDATGTYGSFAVNASTGVWTYTLDNAAHQNLAAGETQHETFTVTVTDDQGATATQDVTITIQGTNDAPVITSAAQAGTVKEDTTLVATGTVSSSDVDHGATAAYSGDATGTYGSFAVNASTGVWTYTLDNAAHQNLAAGETQHETFTVTVTDDQGATATQDVTITIQGTNDAPVITSAAQAGTVKEDTTLVATGTVSSSDVDHGATAAYSGDATGTYGSFAVNASTGVWTYTLDNAAHQNLAAGETQHETFTVTVTDDQGATATQDVTITIQGTNDAPVITSAAQAGTVKEDTTLVATGTVSSSDVDHGATAAYSGDATGTYGSFAVNASTGVWTYTLDNAAHQNLAAGETQHETFTVTVTDDQGATATQDVTITIQGTNDAPVITSAAQAGTVKEDTTLVATGTVSSSDVDHGATAAYSGDATGTYGSFAVNASTGVWTYTLDNAAHQNLAAGETQHETFTVTVTDDQGATATQDVTITIQGTNDAPVITSAAQAGTVKEDTTLVATGTVSSSDVDHGATAAYSGDATGTYGSFAVNASTGVWTYTLDNAAHQNLAAGETQHETFTVTVTDDQGATATQDVTITIQGTNDAPVITSAAQAGTVKEDTTLVATGTVSSSDVDHGATAAYSGDATGTYGSFAVNASTGVWTYTLDNAAHQNLAAGETQHETFTVTVTDDQGATATQDVTITIQGTNDAPVITSAAQAGTVKEDTTLVATGTVSSSDVDHGATAAYSGDATGTYGSFAVNASTGVWTYTLDNAAHQNLAAGETQHETFTVTVTDDQGATATQDVTITIQGTNDAPVITSAAQAGTVKEDTTLVATGTVSSSDVDHGATAAYSGDATGTYGSFAVNASTGVWTYTLDNAAHQNLAAGETQHETFTVTVTDDQGATATQDVTITIQGTNDAPDIQVVTTDSAAAALTETNSGLSTSGTLTVTDVDTLDTVSSSVNAVVASGTTAGLGLTNGQLQAMLSVSPTSGLAANSGDTHNLTWNFNSGTQAFNYLAQGQSLVLTYTVQSTDNHSATATQTVTVTINGTNETAVAIAAIDADSGRSSTDFITNDMSLTVSGTHGTFNSGEKVQVSSDGGATWFDATSTATTWSFVDPTSHTSSFTYQARIVDASNGVGNTTSQAVTIDTSAPNAPVITTVTDNVNPVQGTLANAGFTNDNTPTLNGTAEANSTMTVLDGTTVLGTALANGTGVWTFTPAALGDGAHSFTATATDVAGNQGAASAAFTTTIDTAAPTQTVVISTVTDNVGLYQGALTSGGVTDDTSLALAGTYTGTLGAGEVVAVYDGATRLGTASASGGTWTYTDASLANGDAVSYTVRVEDAASNQGTASAAFTTTIDTVAPPNTTSITSVNDNVSPVTGNLSNGASTNDNTLSLSGTSGSGGNNGLTIGIFDGSTLIGTTTTTSGQGAWGFTTTALSDGVHSLTAAVLDAAGNIGTQTAAFNVTVDTVAPNAPTITTVTDDVTPVTGTVANNGFTNDTTPTLTGTAEANSTVTILDGVTTLGTATANGSGAWTFTTAALGQATHSFTATATDAAGNVSGASAAYAVTVDTAVAAPVITAITDDVTPVTGTVANNGFTNDTTPTLTGTAEANSTVTILDGATTLGTATANGTGAWTFTSAALSQASHSFTAIATDLAGNVSAASTAYAVTIDTAAPSAPTITTVTDDVTPVTGTVANNGFTNDTTPTLMGTAEANSKVTILDGVTTLGTATANGSGAWTFTTAALGQATHSFTATATDAAGNVSAASTSYSVTVDTSAPTAPVITTVTDDVTPVTGTVANNGFTNDTLPTLTGTAEANSTVTILDGATTLGTTTANGAGAWTFTTAALSQAAHSFTATATDAAGNAGVASATYTVTVDTTAPNAPAVTGFTTDSGTVGDHITNDTTLTINGTAEANSTVTVFRDGVSIGTTTANGSGIWNQADAATLSNGTTYQYTAQATDAAGNTGAVSASYAAIIDTTAPTVSSVVATGSGITAGAGDLNAGHVVTLTVNTSEVVTVTGGTPTLTLNDGGTATYQSGSGSSALVFTYTVAAGQNTADLTVTGSALNGATILDGAGNAADLAGAVTNPAGVLQIDTTAPTVSSVVATGSGITAGAGDLNAGHVVTLTVNTSEVVTVTGGTPTLTLNDGGTATYQSGSGSSALVFTYTVAAGQNTADLTVTGSALNGATILDGAGNAANLAGAVTNPAGVLQIDTTAPTVSSVVATGSGITAGAGDLNAGHVVTLTVNTSEVVTVTGGTPTLTLNDGGTATYQSGSGSSALVFTYTVAAGQNTADLTVMGSALNGATILDGAGNAADLAGAVTNPAGVLQIDTTAPTVSSVVATGSGITAGAGDLNAGHVVTLTVITSEVVTVTGGTPTLTLNDGGTATYQSGSGSSALVFTYTVAAGQNTADLTVTGSALNGATILDGAGNAANLAGAVTNPAGILQIDTTAPTAPTISHVGDGGATGGADHIVSNQAGDATVTGSAEANSTVTVQSGVNTLGTASADGSGNWTYTLTAANITTVGQGSGKSVTATATDAAGNASSPSTAFNFSVDTLAPTTTIGGLVLSADTGTSTSDFITKTAAQTITGTLSAALVAGETLFGSLDGGTTWTNLNGKVSGTTLTWNGVTLTGSNTLELKVTDTAGNDGTVKTQAYVLDTSAPTVSTPFTLGGSVHTWTLSSTYSDTGSGVQQISVTDTTNTSTFIPFTNATAGSLSGSWLANGTTTGNVRLSTTDSVNYTVTDFAGNTTTGTTVAPAGVAGQSINLALADPSTDHVGAVTATIAGVPAGWTLSEGTNNGDGTWTVHTNDPSTLTVTTPATYAGAIVLDVAMTWTNADGSTGNAFVSNNVEAYAPGSPIFAVSADDHLTASSSADLLVFAQPIAHDVVHNFDTAADKIDLIGFGISDFAGLAIADDANGNAVITLASGSTITVLGVHAADLGAANFEFNVEPVTTNAGTMTIGDGAILPLGGIVDNSGTIALGSTGSETDLQVLVESLTLQGGGHLVMSDDDHNVIIGGAASATLVNMDNTISGAGQIGAGQMTLVNHGTIVADGTHALVIDTGANAVVNSGTLEATGVGGLVIDSALINSGSLWAHGGNVVVHGDVSGSGSATIGGNAMLEFGGAADGTALFAAGGNGTLVLDHAAAFTGSVAGLGAGDVLDFGDMAFGANATVSYVSNATATGGVLSVSDGVHSAQIAMQGQYSAAGFQAAGDAGTGTAVAYAAPVADQHLVGTAGDDGLVGGAGNDVIDGHGGNDVLVGGAGSDTFVFDTANHGVDTVLDFNASGSAASGDFVELSAAVFTGLTTAVGNELAAGEFASANGGGAADTVGAGVHVIYDSATGNLYYDADGGDAANRELLATLHLTNAADTFDHHDVKVGP